MATLNSTFLILFCWKPGVRADPLKYYVDRIVEDRRAGRIVRVAYVVFLSCTCRVF